MFKKPIKIKSNTQVKASERKVFKDLMLNTFPNLTEAEFNDFLSKKEVLTCLKVVTHDELVIKVYAVQKRPVAFEVRGRIFPTIYLLWKFPNLVYAFTTHQQVMNFITSGADLMLPGVVTPPSQSGLSKYGSLAENDYAYVNLSTNQAAIAVGVAGQSSASMARTNARGKCVIIYHFYGDYLCLLEGLPAGPITNLGPPSWLTLKNYDEDFPALDTTPQKETAGTSKLQTEGAKGEYFAQYLELFKEPPPKEPVVFEDKKQADIAKEMDELLMYCFLGALKYSNVTVPVLTSNFFKLHMLPMCPADKTLDIKKSSYRKLKPFLEEMAEVGIIDIKEVKKGVETIIAIIKNHAKYTEFYIEPENRPQKEAVEPDNASATNVVESYVITQNVLPIFQLEGYKKGDTVLGSNIRNCVTRYVREHNLQHESNPRLVMPKEALAKICATDNPVNWEELFEKVCESMKNCYTVTSGDEEFMNKGKVPPITMTVSVRSGNKKVTLIDNLELFGIRLPEFAKECQHGVAASTSISRPPGKKSDQLLVQGNQVLFVYNLLTDKYKIPKKYIKGLENAPKKKK